jgi:hypothetical protein
LAALIQILRHRLDKEHWRTHDGTALYLLSDSQRLSITRRIAERVEDRDAGSKRFSGSSSMASSSHSTPAPSKHAFQSRWGDYFIPHVDITLCGSSQLFDPLLTSAMIGQKGRFRCCNRTMYTATSILRYFPRERQSNQTKIHEPTKPTQTSASLSLDAHPTSHAFFHATAARMNAS